MDVALDQSAVGLRSPAAILSQAAIVVAHLQVSSESSVSITFNHFIFTRPAARGDAPSRMARAADSSGEPTTPTKYAGTRPVIAAFHLNKGASIKDAKAPPIRRALMAILLEAKLGRQNSREKRRESRMDYY